MAVSAEQAIRAWINARPGLTGKGCPLPLGAYLLGHAFRSPAAGAYCLVIREPGTQAGIIAESHDPSVARITAHCYGGTISAAENACTALANAFQSLTGCPEPCGNTGTRILAADNFTDPGYVPMPASGGEQHLFTTSADFVLTTS